MFICIRFYIRTYIHFRFVFFVHFFIKIDTPPYLHAQSNWAFIRKRRGFYWPTGNCIFQSRAIGKISGIPVNKGPSAIKLFSEGSGGGLLPPNVYQLKEVKDLQLCSMRQIFHWAVDQNKQALRRHAYNLYLCSQRTGI